jgi:hypothetical protein
VAVAHSIERLNYQKHSKAIQLASLTEKRNREREREREARKVTFQFLLLGFQHENFSITYEIRLYVKT